MLFSGELTLTELYRNYQQMCENENKPAASQYVYSDIFNKEFNIGFFKPKKDQCDFCESYKHYSATDKEKNKEQYEKHHEEKELGRKEKDQDKKKDTNFIVASFDLQAVLPAPIGQASIFYYKSKLNCYNLTVSIFI